MLAVVAVVHHMAAAVVAIVDKHNELQTKSLEQMKRISWIGILIVSATISAFGQNPSEALRYSLLKPGGTARGLALSGAMGAVGADATAMTINPAGIAFYRRSEIM